MSPPLAGIRVLDLTLNLPGPYASYLLATQGAEVLRVEPPRGDPARVMRPFFPMLNRGKRGMTLDLKSDEGVARLHELVQQADVLLEGFRPGVLGRLGFDPQQVCAAHPRLIWCAITAFGQQGPLHDLPGHDLNAQALAGACHVARGPKGPRPEALPVADLSTSLAAVAAIHGALFQRERTGQGAFLDLAMTDTLVGWSQLWGEGIDLGRGLRGPRRFIERLSRERLYALPHYGLFPCRDGTWIALGIVDEDRFWRALCRALGLRGVGRLPMAARAALGPVLRPLVARSLRRQTRAHWLTALRGLPVSPVHDHHSVRADPHLLARGLFDPHGWAVSPLPHSVPLAEGTPGAAGWRS